MNMMFKIMYLYLFCSCIYAWMRTKLQVGNNSMITKIYYSIGESWDDQWGKVRCTLFYYIWYLLDMHSYDMSKMQMTGGKMTWLDYSMTSPTSSVVWSVLWRRGGGVSHHVSSETWNRGEDSWTLPLDVWWRLPDACWGKFGRGIRRFHHVGFISG